MLNPVALSRKSPLPFNFLGFSCKPASLSDRRTRIEAGSGWVLGFGNKQCSSRVSLNCGRRNWFGRSEIGCNNPGLISSVSGGGSDGSGGNGGGGDGGDSGSGDGGDSAGKKWSLLSWYLTLLSNYPVVTKAVTSAILTFIGDLICQFVINKASSLDAKRTFLFTFLGLVLVGPTLHFWYLYLSEAVKASGVLGAVSRLILDQFFFSPIFIGVFLSALLTLEGKPSQVIPKLQQEWIGAVLANWQLWIPFQFLNFRFVPQNFQVLAANVVALVWNVILSFKAHKEVLTK